MQIGKIWDNSGTERNYIKNLKKGDKLISIKTTKSLGDIGASGMTFEYDSFIEGKIYEVDHIYR